MLVSRATVETAVSFKCEKYFACCFTVFFALVDACIKDTRCLCWNETVEGE